jgi:hypothetical protein
MVIGNISKFLADMSSTNVPAATMNIRGTSGRVFRVDIKSVRSKSATTRDINYKLGVDYYSALVSTEGAKSNRVISGEAADMTQKIDRAIKQIEGDLVMVRDEQGK